ncbi:MAG TPA: glutathione S-transferase family protein [Alphaproteobacteria bacterium]|nr:glutathione S-transferase family protein [Alphaproteobacteria bacterium]
MADVTLYGSPISTYVRTVRMTLAEKNVSYELVDGWPDHPEIAKRQPFGKIPAFRHGDFELYETPAIVRYVDEAFPGPRLQPEDAKARARMAQILSVHSSYCYPAVIGGIVVERVAPKLFNRPSDEAKIKASVPEADKVVGVLEQSLGAGPYFAGRDLSLADLLVYPVLFYLSLMPEGGPILEKRPGLRKWLSGVGERRSAKETVPPL